MFSRSAIRRPIPLLCSVLFGMACGAASSLLAQTSSIAVAKLQPIRRADRVARDADFATSSPLQQRLPNWVSARNEVAAQPVDLSDRLHLSIILGRDTASEAAFSQLLADQQNPASPLYHQWLTPQQVGQLYGPTANDLDAVSSW